MLVPLERNLSSGVQRASAMLWRVAQICRLAHRPSAFWVGYLPGRFGQWVNYWGKIFEKLLYPLLNCMCSHPLGGIIFSTLKAAFYEKHKLVCFLCAFGFLRADLWAKYCPDYRSSSRLLRLPSFLYLRLLDIPANSLHSSATNRKRPL